MSAYVSLFFFFNDTATTEIYTLSLHDALPISSQAPPFPASRSPRSWTAPSPGAAQRSRREAPRASARSEEHTSELQSPCNLVCRLLLEKKKKKEQMFELMHPVYTDCRIAHLPS